MKFSIKTLLSHRNTVLLLSIFLCFLFLRFYDIENRSQFGWDQVDNAWAAKDILVDHKFPLVGMQAKGSSGFYIGPAYYYLIAVFYFFTNLDPIASGIFAGVIAAITFWTFYFVSKKIFSFPVALLVVFIYTFSLPIMSANRVQWPVNFIAPVSYIIFYALYNILIGREKYLLLLATAVGFSLHIHFTSIFYFIIIFFSTPFFPWKKTIWKHMFIAVPLFLIWLVPNIISEFISMSASGNNVASYIGNYYHGFHIRRMLQLLPDAFIEFESVLIFRILKPLSYILFPLFTLVYCYKKQLRERLVICYLIALWFLVPWVVFTTYSGEISNYYFTLTLPMVVIVLAYLTLWIFQISNMLPKIIIVSFWLYYAFFSVQNFLNSQHNGLAQHRESVKAAIIDGRIIEFVHGNPESYLYYIYMKDKK